MRNSLLWTMISTILVMMAIFALAIIMEMNAREMKQDIDTRVSDVVSDFADENARMRMFLESESETIDGVFTTLLGTVDEKFALVKEELSALTDSNWEGCVLSDAYIVDEYGIVQLRGETQYCGYVGPNYRDVINNYKDDVAKLRECAEEKICASWISPWWEREGGSR